MGFTPTLNIFNNLINALHEQISTLTEVITFLRNDSKNNNIALKLCHFLLLKV